jgi:hypothetical protein
MYSLKSLQGSTTTYLSLILLTPSDPSSTEKRLNGHKMKKRSSESLYSREIKVLNIVF